MNLEDKIRKYIEDNGIYYKENSRSFMLDCPNCGKDKLSIAKEEGNYICYYCADTVRGPAPEPILAELTGDTYQVVRRNIRGFEFIAATSADGFLKEKPVFSKKEEDDEVEPRKIPYYFVPITDERAKEGRAYLINKRGVPLFLAEELGIMYNPVHKQVIFPVYQGFRFCGYQGRSIYSKLKYNDIDKSKHLMFENTITDNRVILCEGPISALKFAKTGIGFIATMGKVVSERQIRRLLELKIDTIYLGLDRDAYKEIKSFYDQHHTKFKIFLLEVPPDKDDFGDCNFEECLEIFKQAVPLNRMSFLPDIL